MDQRSRLLLDSFYQPGISTVGKLATLTNTISKINQKMGWGSVSPIVAGQNPSTEPRLEKQSIKTLSINPQTMNDDTLKLIGRHHTVEQIKEAFTLARECGFDNINMDLIIGLPGETREHIERTMREVALLAPDSLTVHSLAIKRAARLNIFWEKYKDYAMVNTDDIINMTADCAAAMGMEPYYLYRQKNMAGNFENVGYSKPDREGIYNILIMEEKQTIMAVGAGASTKVVFPEENRIERVENVKDVTTYIENIDEMIDRKRRFFYG